ncbi:MAG: tetratricopeptide repeat protein [Candidatus Omnitrophica bacterium]|nr:tetratricopeptide repeat protein [Candidatus Omnitrophota bacterium]
MRINSKKYLFVFILAIFIMNGCAAVGVIHTSNPWQKMRDAYQMMNYGRFLRAEQFLREAEKIFEEKENDHGIAEAYFSLGNMYKNNHEHNTLQDTKKSRECFEHAHNLFRKNENFIGVAKSLFGLANAYGIENNSLESCSHYDESLNAYYKAKKLNPSAIMPIMIKKYKDFPDMVEDYKNHFCK